MTSVAIVGAGIAGLTLADKIRPLSSVTVYEKSRGVGGRMATRYADPYQFDHGAQYFTLKHDSSRTYLERAMEDGLVVAWQANEASIPRDGDTAIAPWRNDRPHYVGAPKMNSLAKALSAKVDVRLNCEISAIEDHDGVWCLFDKGGVLQGQADWVILAAPAPQTRVLMPQCFTHTAQMEPAEMSGCFTLMVGLENDPGLAWQTARVEDSPVGWIAVNSSKPGRDTAASLVIQSTNAWADEYIEDDLKEVETILWKETCRITGLAPTDALHKVLHRWRYANVRQPASQPLLLDTKNKLAACGDWCIEGRLEGAIESALQLAEAIKAEL